MALPFLFGLNVKLRPRETGLTQGAIVLLAAQIDLGRKHVEWRGGHGRFQSRPFVCSRFRCRPGISIARCVTVPVMRARAINAFLRIGWVDAGAARAAIDKAAASSTGGGVASVAGVLHWKIS